MPIYSIFNGKGRITLDSNDEELKIEMSAEKKMFFQRTKKLGHFVKKITRIYNIIKTMDIYNWEILINFQKYVWILFCLNMSMGMNQILINNK